ncbi:DNA polymerase III subunit delta [Acetobacter fallax]|uniref:DNA-directed DNA polymerase n=1 Tax=Acetobacter fallax TaxID=1737473 RepID=A0ABX0K9F4_9PROT|nr:DNA polymerase III subunit delta [Acetobacter fallax]NHO35935.1 DNA polymerase III subunit delta [Acetobacter fallax]
MKIDARSIGKVLNAPDAWRFVLLHGDDSGLIREYASDLTRRVAGSLDDPFRVAALTRETHDRFAEEATALSLDGGQRVVWVREGSDSLAGPVSSVLDGVGSALIIVEAGVLPARAKLRKLAEARQDSASIGCYPEEGRVLEGSVRRMFGERQVRITNEALGWLVTQLGSDRAGVRNEIEKLALYAGPDHELDLEDVRVCIGDSGSASIDDSVFLALEGDRAGTDLALERALSEGANPVAVARVLLGHISRLRRVKAATEQGESRVEAMKSLRPPVFFKKQQSFERALSLWSLPALAELAQRTQAFELSCKQTGAMDMLLCRRHLSVIAAKAAAASRRR